MEAGNCTMVGDLEDVRATAGFRALAVMVTDLALYWFSDGAVPSVGGAAISVEDFGVRNAGVRSQVVVSVPEFASVGVLADRPWPRVGFEIENLVQVAVPPHIAFLEWGEGHRMAQAWRGVEQD